MIRKVRVKGATRFRVTSPKKKKNMGTYRTLGEAEKRERQIKFFVNIGTMVRGMKRSKWAGARTLSAQRSGKRKKGSTT